MTRGHRINFAKWLDITMENKGISNRSLAAKIGVHESVTSRWRAGRTSPSIENCEALAIALDVEFLRLAVTAGILDATAAHAEPLPAPEPSAVRTRIRQQLEHIKGLTPASIEALLAQWDEDMEDGEQQ